MSLTLAEDLACALDPALFMERLGLTPDPWQAELLRSTEQRFLLLCTRQAGKSTVTAVKALHRILYYPGSLVLMLSPSERQSSEIFKKVLTFYADLGKPVKEKYATLLRLELENGSRCVSLPGNEHTIRGYSGVDLLIIDEASRVKDDLYYSVRPMLAVSGGSLIALTTPFGKRGFFFEEWEKADETWRRFKVTAYDCPRITREFLDEERRALGEWWFKQEYLCEFVEQTNSLFSYESIVAAFENSDVKPLFGDGGLWQAAA
jgi:hypothetical protein